MPRVKLFDENEVLTKAIQLFWKQGYSATSISDLVNHLGINRASIYDTYGDKEQLFLKAFEHYRKTNTERISEFFENEPNVKSGVKQLFEIAIKESVSDKDKKGCFVVNITTELIPGDDIVQNLLIENRKTFTNLFYTYLKKGEEEGQIKKGKDLKSIASLLFTLYNGLKVVSKINPDKKELMNSLNMALTLLD
ncbi:TetR/AcrR family transcriptional regulator [Mangrovivirga cuniculi]|uniref:TetR/AcrR family transcriptional regulator n=1 Tax=Mangrovivirga cuniculi TaxID=2715131 RepID=A0A4D7JYM8_9BACT|nr:TetR/AcrR family transcriptional regulator [Mangrovivirga cuniculi]QCK15805.1 TetR/AcrR family transcriptional regulator [Mangrovivirga cuniculi]